jgi:hypothetical protein
MNLAFATTIVSGLATLFAYSLIERRINQRACPKCGLRVSIDSPDEGCPRCEITANQKTAAEISELNPRFNWGKFTLIFLPLSIAILDVAVVRHERLQPETQKAIRLVKESASRKENFTIQHYIYSIIYYQRSRDNDLTVEGWKADQPGGPGTPVNVEFDYTLGGVRHALIWEVDLASQKAKSKNQEADYVSWD